MIGCKRAGDILILLLLLLAIFHVVVMAGAVPPEIVWGGQALESPSALLPLEIIALAITIIFMVIIAVRTERIKVIGFRKTFATGTWLIFAYFLLNTIGNLASGVSMEKIIFTPITIIMAALALRVAIGD